MSTDNISLNVFSSDAIAGAWTASNSLTFNMMASSGGCVCGNTCCAGGCYGPYVSPCVGCGYSICQCNNYPYQQYPSICQSCFTSPCVCNNIYTMPWAPTYNFKVTSTLTKSASKADILGDFFGPGVHALVSLDDTSGADFIPFMDKFNMIWIQSTMNSWAAYDRDEFMKWVESEETVFYSIKLSKEEVIKRMMKPEKTNE